MLSLWYLLIKFNKKNMIFPTAPKFSKIEIYLKDKSGFINEGIIERNIPSNKIFKDAAMVITGNFLLIILEQNNDNTKSPYTYTEIFDLDQIKSYITYPV